MPSWPTSLMPYPLIVGYQETPPVTAIRTEVDVGPAKQRQRYTAAARRVNGTVTLRTKAEVDTLDTFYTTTLKGGSLTFEWTDRNGVTRTFRFVAGPEALRYEGVDPNHWNAHMQLEVLP